MDSLNRSAEALRHPKPLPLDLLNLVFGGSGFIGWPQVLWALNFRRI
jgi:hypothetical protein